MQSEVTYFASSRKARVNFDHSVLLGPASAYLTSDDCQQRLKERHRELQNTCEPNTAFAEWALQLRHGFNIILHGYGCKRDVLETFSHEHLTDAGLVKINACRGRICAKQIVVAVAHALSGIPSADLRSMSIDALLRFYCEDAQPRCHVLLVIHNLDAPSLRNRPDQLAISRLAFCKAVHMIASVDHPNFPLLHDLRIAQNFLCLWHHVATYAPLSNQAISTPPVFAAQNHGETQQDAAVVLGVLTQSSQAVFRAFAEALLGEILSDEDEILGISYEHLFRLCQERFILSSDCTLRMHLNEFKDHDLLKERKAQDDGTLIYIPLPVAEIQRLLDFLNELLDDGK